MADAWPKCPHCINSIGDAIGPSGSDAFKCRSCGAVFDRDEAKQEPECAGGYYDGVDDRGQPVGHTCTEYDGCGLPRCPRR